MKPEQVIPQENLERPTLAHVVPFIAWLFVAHMLGDPEGWKYAVRSAICLGLFVWLRPWRWYGRLDLKNIPFVLLSREKDESSVQRAIDLGIQHYFKKPVLTCHHSINR